MKRRVSLLLLGVLVICSLTSSSPVVGSDIAADVNVLILVATGFGWNYFDARHYFEEWGANVKVVSHTLDHEVDGCFNQDPTTIISDYLTSELNETLLSQFDCLYIPSGGHWNGLISSSTVLNWISRAHELGLVIGSTCIGNRVISHANNIVNGCEVAYYSMTNLEMENEGATIVTARAVRDNRIITGGTGSGPPEGYTGAPTYEVCAAMIQEVLGISPITETTITPPTGTNETDFLIQFSIENITNSYPLINHTDIHEMGANIYPKNLRESAIALQLNESGGSYTATISDLELGDYFIDVSIRYANQMYMVYREAMSFTVLETLPTTTTTSSTSSISSPDYILPVLGISGAAVVVVVLLVLKKRF